MSDRTESQGLDEIEIRGSHAVGRIGTQELHVPASDAPPKAPFYVQFLPSDVTLSQL